MLKLLITEACAWIKAFIRNVPGRIGGRVRRVWYRRRFHHSDDLHIGTNCKFVAPDSMSFYGSTRIGDECYFNADGGFITLGDRASFNVHVHLNASVGGRITIGAHCLFGPGVVMRTANHRFSNVDVFIQDQGHDVADIVIEDDCWIGANAVILGGVHIGRGSIIGAGAVVTQDVPPMVVSTGIPAKVRKYRGQEIKEM